MHVPSPPRAPRWLWLLTLTTTGVSSAYGVWAVALFVDPPSVEEQPEGLIFLGALLVLVLAVPALGFLTSAVILRRRPRSTVVPLLVLALLPSSFLALPSAMALPLRHSGTPDTDRAAVAPVPPPAVEVFEIGPDGLLVARERVGPSSTSDVERVEIAVRDLVGGEPSRGRRTHWSLPCTRAYTGLVEVGDREVTVRLLGPPRAPTARCRLSPAQERLRRQQLAWTVRANLDRDPGRIVVLEEATGRRTTLRPDPDRLGDR